MKTKLTACGACGHMISASAKACPQCGHKVGNAGTAALAAAGWLLIILGGLGLFGGNMAVGIPLILVGAGLNFAGDALKRRS